MKLSKTQLFWKHHIESWERSNIPQSKYCIKNGINPKSFSAQKSLYKKNIKAATANNVKTKTPLFLASKKQFPDHKFHIVLNNKINLTFDNLPDPTWIASLIDSLGNLNAQDL